MNIRFDVLRALSQVVISVSNVFDRQEPLNSVHGWVLTDPDTDKNDMLNHQLLTDIAKAQDTLGELAQILVNAHNSRYRAPFVSPMSRGTAPLAEREQAFKQKFAELQKAYHMHAEVSSLMDLKTRENLEVPAPTVVFADVPESQVTLTNLAGFGGSTLQTTGGGGSGSNSWSGGVPRDKIPTVTAVAYGSTENVQLTTDSGDSINVDDGGNSTLNSYDKPEKFLWVFERSNGHVEVTLEYFENPIQVRADCLRRFPNEGKLKWLQKLEIPKHAAPSSERED